MEYGSRKSFGECTKKVGVLFMNEYMEKANEVAKENLVSNEGGPFGACVVKYVFICY